MEREPGKRVQTSSQIHMKEITLWTTNTGMGNSAGQVGTFTKEITSTMKDTAMERCTGLMEVSIKANGRKAYNMGTERCISLMDLRRLEYLRIMCLREDLSKLIKIKSLQSSDLGLNQAPNRIKQECIKQLRRISISILIKRINQLKPENFKKSRSSLNKEESETR